jgi:hypothetical protein
VLAAGAQVRPPPELVPIDGPALAIDGRDLALAGAKHRHLGGVQDRHLLRLPMSEYRGRNGLREAQPNRGNGVAAKPIWSRIPM